VLVVDGSAVQRQHAVALRRRIGIRSIFEARSGSEALDVLAGLKTRDGGGRRSPQPPVFDRGAIGRSENSTT
jgi:hypothetical protein